MNVEQLWFLKVEYNLRLFMPEHVQIEQVDVDTFDTRTLRESLYINTIIRYVCTFALFKNITYIHFTQT